MKDLYESLGVSRTDSADTIKKAYRDAAFKYHPDRNPNNKGAEDRFKEISAAYSVLGDEVKRTQYDQYGSADDYARNQHGQTKNPFGDSFWDWYYESTGQNTQDNSQRTQYRRTYTYSHNTEPQTKKVAFFSLIRYLITFFAGLFFFRFSLFILPFGPILCITALVNGASGAIRSIKHILSPKIK